MSSSGLHSQEVVVDKDSRISFGSLSAHPTDLPELELMWSGFMFQACQPYTWTAGRCCFKRYQPPGWPWTWSQGVGRSGVSLAHLVLSTLSPVFHRASPSFPTAETVCLALGEATCSHVHSCQRLFLWPGHDCSPPHPTLKACLSACRGAVHGVEKSEAAGLSELVPGNLTFPLSPPCPGWIWGVSLSVPPHLTHSPSVSPVLPQTFLGLRVFHPGQSSKTVGVPTLSALGTALTCNRSGKQPQAGLGRGLKEREL